MENKEKLSVLFNFLAEFSLLRKRQLYDISSIKGNNEFLDFKDIEPNKYVTNNFLNGNIDELEKILVVKQVSFKPCDNPPQDAVEWINEDWKDPSIKDVTIQPKKFNSKGGGSEPFRFFHEEVDQLEFNEWLSAREKWQKKAIELKKAEELYNKLYAIYRRKIETNDTNELLIGNYVLHATSTKNKILHPIITRNADIYYDLDTTDITLSISLSNTKFHSYLLNDIPNIQQDRIGKLLATFEEEDPNPLSDEEVLRHLRPIANSLTPKNLILNSESIGNNVGSDHQLIFTNDIILFLKTKEDRSSEYLKEVSDAIDRDIYPQHMLSFVDDTLKKELFKEIEVDSIERLANVGGESKDILLAKEANEEQLNIIKRLEQGHDGVLVQGPPGTGKTHTIANITGHFLSQGKTVLITSHTSKALSVLKEKLPKQLQPLAVSLIDSSNKDMENSINYITEFISSNSESKLKKDINFLEEKRGHTINELAKIRKKILAIKVEESSPVVLNGQGYTLTELAQKIKENEEHLNIIPGNVRSHIDFPISNEDLDFLYWSNEQVSKDDESELLLGLVDPDTLISSGELKTYNNTHVLLNEKIFELSSIIKIGMTYKNCIIKSGRRDFINLSEKVTDLEVGEVIKGFNKLISNFEKWKLQSIVAGHKQGNYRAIWDQLIESIENTKEAYDSNFHLIFDDAIKLSSNFSFEETEEVAKSIYEIIDSKVRLKMKSLSDKRLVTFFSDVSVYGKTVQSREELDILIKYLDYKICEQSLISLWNRLIGNFESVESSYNSISEINYYLAWQDQLNSVKNQLSSIGVDTKILFSIEYETKTDEEYFTRLISDLEKIFPVLKYILEALLVLNPLYVKYNVTFDRLKSNSGSDYNVKLLKALNNGDETSYNETYDYISKIYNKNNIMNRRQDLLNMLKEVAPSWAKAIDEREGIHGLDHAPDSNFDAWIIKQYALIIDKVLNVNYSDLLKESYEAGRRLREQTAELAAAKAWHHLLINTSTDDSLKRSLVAWKQAVKKIGKGTGKRAPMYRREAQSQMKAAQKAIPTWIMPMDQVINNMNAIENSFDIVIIDEASQSPLTALGVLFLGKKVIVVGDDKQVSPTSFATIEQVNGLHEKHLKDAEIPSYIMYDGETSVYDLAAQVYEPLMLREHFRCVPEIINFSSYDSYDGQIKALRGSNTASVQPPLVEYRVHGTRRNDNTNHEEAKAIAAIIYGMTKTKKYDGLSIGVVIMSSFASHENLIRQEISKLLSPSEMEDRNIMIGNASKFQGDERDIIILSLIDSNEGETPLRTETEGPLDSTKKRYNVASSRARDQLWVVHSLDVTKDLRVGDYRRKIIEHARSPYFNEDRIISKSDSVFEEEVAKALISRGFRIEQQKKVGPYSIDMIAYDNEEQIAIECDGERYHSSESQVANDLERQTILERVGWKFIRLRGSEYFRNKEKAIDRIEREILEHGVSKFADKSNFEGKTEISTELEDVLRIVNKMLSASNQEVQNETNIQSIDGNSVQELTRIKPEEMTRVQREVKSILGKELTMDNDENQNNISSQFVKPSLVSTNDQNEDDLIHKEKISSREENRNHKEKSSKRFVSFEENRIPDQNIINLKNGSRVQKTNKVDDQLIRDLDQMIGGNKDLSKQRLRDIEKSKSREVELTEYEKRSKKEVKDLNSKFSDPKFKVKINDHIGIISKSGVWSKELNLVSWGDNEVRYDLRRWDYEDGTTGRGVTLSLVELEKLFSLIEKEIEEHEHTQ